MLNVPPLLTKINEKILVLMNFFTSKEEDRGSELKAI